MQAAPQQSRNIDIFLFVPCVSPEKLADLWVPATSEDRIKQLLTMRTRIQNQVLSGVIPSFHIGKRLVINSIQLALSDFAQSNLRGAAPEFHFMVSSMPTASFAEQVGFDLGVVDGWVRKGYLPSLKQGGYRVINLIELFDRCRSWQSDQWSALVDRRNNEPVVINDNEQ